MGEGSEVVGVAGRSGGVRGNNGRQSLPTKFVEQISFQEIEEREVSWNLKNVFKTKFNDNN